TRSNCSLIDGDLVISEVLADPADLDEGDAPEWIEIYNATTIAQDLAGLDVIITGSGSPREFSLNVELSLEPGAYAVVGGQRSDAFDYIDASTGFQLANGGATIELRCGDTRIDEVSYGSNGPLPGAMKGMAIGFDGGQAPSAIGNDDAANWCTRGDVYDGFNVGTPGEANVSCGGGVATGCTESGTERSTVLPSAGELVITEVLANPDGADSLRTSEWIELYNAAANPVDLNGLRIISRTGNSREFFVEGTECLPVAAGDFAVIGASSDTSLNGQVMVDAVAPDLELYNSESTLEILNGTALIDSAEVPSATEGVSAFVSTLSADGNDSPGAFCKATVSGMFDGFGSPGFDGEVCDTVGGGENNNNNSGGGSNNSGSVIPGECSEGSVARGIVSPVVGDIAIAEVHSNPSGADNGKEYIELLLSAGINIDLNEMVIVARSDDSGNERRFDIDLKECQSFGDGRVVTAVGGHRRGPAVVPAWPPPLSPPWSPPL
ncbi:MAG: lamin tail domain-containing protein, partial [Myxococcota bacterium]